ncbi:MAG: prolipoprotein diacylglyceryl transferase [Anaeromyxobacter sp.]
MAMIRKALYGALFVVILPAALLAWARAADRWVAAPALFAPGAGVALATGGLLLMAWGWATLWHEGGGLPMNAFPPPRRAVGGPFALVGHPIYVGFTAAVLGGALWTGSPAALWLCTPAVAAGAAALVLGHERLDLLRRFGPPPRPLLSLPPPGDGAPRPRERLGAAVLVLGTWLGLYALVSAAGPWAGAPETWLAFERGWPVLPAAELLYASAYPAALLAFLLAPSRTALRQLAAGGLLACALVFPVYLLFPLVAPPRPFDATGPLAELIRLERALDTPGCALPSFHVVWALLAARALAPRTRLAWPWAAGVIAACAAVGAHAVLDLAAGVAAYAAVAAAPALWARLRGAAEAVANSWADLRVGPVRLINHGLWAGLGTFVAFALASAWMGAQGPRAIAVLFVAAIVGAGAWAQAIEGRGLSRPFGFYGGLIGGGLAAAAAPALGLDLWTTLAAMALGTPLGQGVGRLRCLVQGCCHGAEAPEEVGIRYRRPLSRVTKAGLGGRPLHPTPLYSLLWNLLCTVVLLRLAALETPAHALFGLSLALGGLGRFVEEAYRGEPQTPVLLGLRLYQWLAVASVVGGAAVTAVGRSAPLPLPAWNAPALLVALLAGVGSAFAMGVDFPESQRRFSRLA